MSDRFLENAKKAATVVISKNVIDLFLLILSHSSNRSIKYWLLINFPFILIRSLNLIKCGDVYTLQLYPDASRNALKNAMVDPFPLVPAI